MKKSIGLIDNIYSYFKKSDRQQQLLSSKIEYSEILPNPFSITHYNTLTISRDLLLLPLL